MMSQYSHRLINNSHNLHVSAQSMHTTAQLAQPDVMHHALAHLTSNPGAMLDLGLAYKEDEDDGMNFDD